MPATDSPAIICARFLQANNYNHTLETFLAEAGLPPDAGTSNAGDLTLEKILEEKKVYDLSLRFEKVNVADARRWRLPAPSTPHIIPSLPLPSANLLHVSVEEGLFPLDRTDPQSQTQSQILLATTTDRRLHLISPDPTFSLLKSLSTVHDSPILSCVSLQGPSHLTTVSVSMSGQVVLYDHVAERVLDQRRDHKKYVVKIASYRLHDATYVATAGWDAKVFVYCLLEHRISTTTTLKLGEALASLSLPTNPETILFVQPPQTDTPVLIVTRRDSSSLHYFAVPPPSPLSPPPPPIAPVKLKHLGSQNLSPHSSWTSFSPSSVSLCPTDPTLVAVATSAVPHMKVITARLLIPPLSLTEQHAPLTQAEQARNSLAIADRESEAIGERCARFPFRSLH
ncbi:MAG: hypothetical protein Q9190_004674 [Brigantiaea leucoxantha]